MTTYPTIYRHTGIVQKPAVGSLDDQMTNDPVVRGDFEGGYVVTRARYTRITRKWTIHYDWMSTTNKNTIQAFEEARVAGAESFTWTNPADSTAYTVRFLGPVLYKAHPNTNFLWWTLDFILEQV